MCTRCHLISAEPSQLRKKTSRAIDRTGREPTVTTDSYNHPVFFSRLVRVVSKI